VAIVDRRQAIAAAVGAARADDVVLIAGKGHEDYQIVGKTKHPFDDREEARKALQKLASAAGTRQS
jgi:UDP-N-acetylmuramoyl-L-alanyl-D-glutamate--2,6-diaminopimelate ligase